MGYFRIVMGKNALGIELEVAWATPGEFTIYNTPCNSVTSDCGGGEGPSGSKVSSYIYVDPSKNPTLLVKQRHL